MKKGYIWVGILLLLFLGACGQGGNAPTSGSEGEEEMRDWSYNVHAVQNENELHVTMTVTNEQEHASDVAFSSGQKYELILKNEHDEVIYRYTEGKMFTMAIVTEDIPPGATLSFTEVIQLEGVDSGQYELEAEVLIISIDGDELEDPDLFKDVIMVEIK